MTDEEIGRDRPTPGPNQPVPSWLEYDQLEAALHDYLGNIERLDAPEPPYNQWFDLFEFAATWGLEVSVLPKSWYNLGSTVHVVFYPPERYR